MAWLIISQDVSRADLSSLVFRSNGILFVKCFTWSIKSITQIQKYYKTWNPYAYGSSSGSIVIVLYP